MWAPSKMVATALKACPIFLMVPSTQGFAAAACDGGTAIQRTVRTELFLGTNADLSDQASKSLKGHANLYSCNGNDYTCNSKTLMNATR
eukprot:6486182-Amphidinium_carterae.1